jgi:hypothetical protein
MIGSHEQTWLYKFQEILQLFNSDYNYDYEKTKLFSLFSYLNVTHFREEILLYHTSNID